MNQINFIRNFLMIISITLITMFITSCSESEAETDSTTSEDLVTVTLSSDKTSLNENGDELDSAIITATLSSTTDSDVTVTLSLEGTSTIDEDYVIDNTSITIYEGDTVGTVELTPIPDCVDDDAETIIIDYTADNATIDGDEITISIIDIDGDCTDTTEDATSDDEDTVYDAEVLDYFVDNIDDYLDDDEITVILEAYSIESIDELSYVELDEILISFVDTTGTDVYSDYLNSVSEISSDEIEDIIEEILGEDIDLDTFSDDDLAIIQAMMEYTMGDLSMLSDEDMVTLVRVLAADYTDMMDSLSDEEILYLVDFVSLYNFSAILELSTDDITYLLTIISQDISDVSYDEIAAVLDIVGVETVLGVSIDADYIASLLEYIDIDMLIYLTEMSDDDLDALIELLTEEDIDEDAISDLFELYIFSDTYIDEAQFDEILDLLGVDDIYDISELTDDEFDSIITILDESGIYGLSDLSSDELLEDLYDFYDSLGIISDLSEEDLEFIISLTETYGENFELTDLTDDELVYYLTIITEAMLDFSSLSDDEKDFIISLFTSYGEDFELTDLTDDELVSFLNIITEGSLNLEGLSDDDLDFVISLFTNYGEYFELSDLTDDELIAFLYIISDGQLDSVEEDTLQLLLDIIGADNVDLLEYLTEDELTTIFLTLGTSTSIDELTSEDIDTIEAIIAEYA